MSVSAFKRRKAQCRREEWMRVKDATRLRNWRKQRRLSQGQLATLARCTQQFISQLETGVEKTLTPGLAIGIAAWLEVPWEELFEAEELETVPGVASSIESVGERASLRSTRKLSA